MSLLGTIITLGGMVVGGAVGSIVPGVGTAVGMSLGAMVGGAIGGYVGNTLFPDTIDLNLPPPPKPYESRVQVSTYGNPIPIVYESARLAGNVIYMQPVRETVVRSKHRQDGVRYYEYTKTYASTFAIAFCEGPVEGVSRIWVNGEVFADYRDPAGEFYPAGSVALASANLSTTVARAAVYFSIYTGTQTQTADAELSAILGATETPSYRGICYIVFRNFPVGEFRGIPQIEVEIGQQMSASVCSEYFEYADGLLDSSLFICPDTPGWIGDAPVIYDNRLKMYVGVVDQVANRFLIANYQFSGEFDYYTEFEIFGSDYTYHSLYAAPDGILGDWQIFIETPQLGIGRYEAFGYVGYGEFSLAGPATTGKLRLRRDSLNNVYAYYWNNTLYRWEFDGDTAGLLLGELVGSVTPSFDMRTMSTTTLFVNDFIVTNGCENTTEFVY